MGFRSLLLLLMASLSCNIISWTLASSNVCTKEKCTYHLVIAYGWTMTYKDATGAVHNVVLNDSQLQYAKNSAIHKVLPKDVITADGYPRRIFTVNGQYPGPPIQVVEGAQVVVMVTNHLNDHSVSVHFHGIHQLNTYYMDGAAAVTMCPIPPGRSFEHRFIADPVGTHWYHEHTRLVYADGLYGLFVVHPKSRIPPASLPDFLVTVGDWHHEEAADMYGKREGICGNGAIGASPKPANFTSGCGVDGTDLNPSSYVSALFGGRGRWQDKKLPLAEYVVAANTTRRFRLVNPGFWFPMEVSVDGHRVRIVASDGGPIQPIVVDSFYIHVGERIDFELVADQPPDRYWMRARPPCVDDEALAVLRYASATSGDPSTAQSPCTSSSPCTVFNCPFPAYPTGSFRTCITMGDAMSTLTSAKLRDEFGVGDPDSSVLTYFLNFAMVVGGSINARRFEFPAVPYFMRQPPPCAPTPCVDACNCRCTHTLTLPYNRTIQFVISSLQPNDSLMEDGQENVHFHGHNVAVMAMEFPTYNPTTGHWTASNGDIDCRGELCWNATWNTDRQPSFDGVTRPVVKDTIVIPTRGYVVVRFRSTNPGPFMLHCHLDSHVMEGMAMIIDVAPDRRPPLPRGFPTSCDARAFPKYTPKTRKSRNFKKTGRSRKRKPYRTAKRPNSHH